MAERAGGRGGDDAARVAEGDVPVGTGQDRERADTAVGVVHIPGTSFRVLPDGSVARFITSPGSLLDYAVRLQGAIGDIRGLVHQPGCVGDGVVGQPCTCRRAQDADIFTRWGV